MYLSLSNSPSQYVWLRLLIMSLVPFLFPCVWFWQIHGLSAGEGLKYMANVSFHACALICWVFKTNLKDGGKRRGQAFSVPGARERRGSEIGRGRLEMEAGKRKRKRKTIISLPFKSQLGLTVESQVSNFIWQHGWREKLCLCGSERTVLRLGGFPLFHLS